jgi:photosystem II stability/assembly factor-like uncharacterized protein
MNFNSLPEEQQHPELIRRLQQMYQMLPEDRESLLRIQARLSEAAFVLIKGKSQTTVISRPAETYQSTATHRLLGHGTLLNSGINGGGVHMITEQVGWAMKLGPSNRTLSGPVFRTTDGGKTWKQVSLPQEPSGQVFEVYVLDENMVFLLPVQRSVGYQLYFYRTVDAGVTWQRYNWPTIPEITHDGTGDFNFTFLDHMHGWVRVMQKIKNAESLQEMGTQKLFRTDDGGKTWQDVALLPFKYASSDLTFTNAQTGWLITTIYNPTANTSNGNNPEGFPNMLFVTQDGGHTWQQHPLPVRLQDSKKPYRLSDLIFFNEHDGYLFAAFMSDANNNPQPQTYLCATHDGGKTWNTNDAPLPDGVVAVIVDDTHLLAAMNDNYTQYYIYSLLMLSNGLWVPASNKIAVKGEGSMDFLSSQRGLALQSTANGDTNVYRTGDGGKTWQKIGTLPGGA